MTFGILWPVVRRLGALSLFIVGAVHLREYSDAYSAIPTIGPLFMLNFVAATVLGVGLLLPVELLLPRWRTAFVALPALGGVGLSATSLLAQLFGGRPDGPPGIARWAALGSVRVEPSGSDQSTSEPGSAAPGTSLGR